MGVAIARGGEVKKDNKIIENSLEHFDLAKKDGLDIATEVNPSLYKKSDYALNIYVLSGLFNIPFDYKFINKKLIEYIVYGSALAKNFLPSSLKLDSSKQFREYFLSQIKSRKLNILMIIFFFLILLFSISVKQAYSMLKKYFSILTNINSEKRKLMYIKKRNSLKSITDANNYLRGNQ